MQIKKEDLDRVEKQVVARIVGRMTASTRGKARVFKDRKKEAKRTGKYKERHHD
jgi:hypothetical protein